jgi:hypothetical protein
MMLKKSLLALVSLMSVLVFGCKEETKTIEVESVAVTPSEATLTTIGGQTTLVAVVKPDNADNKEVAWSSANEAVATVDAATGVVTAVAEGVVEITATAGGKSGKATVTVAVDSEVIPVESVSVTPATATLTEVGETVALTATVLPADATDKTVTWSSNNAAVATVDAATGVVTAVANGVAEITATAGGKSGKATITVELSIPIGTGTVYAVGTNLDGGKQFATLWIDGEPYRLSKNQGSYAGGVYLDADDNIYATGWDIVGGKFLPTLWVNGEAQLLEDSGYGEAYGVFVDGTDVYVAGCYDAGGSGLELRATLWKNGVRETIGTTYGFATSVYVSGSDVNVAYWQEDEAGRTDDFDNIVFHAALWNNVATILNNDPKMSSEAFGVVADDTGVYVVGRQRIQETLFRATLWKNGVQQELSSDVSIARSVFVDGGDVYVCGLNGEGSYNTASKAVYWKNGTVTNLTDGSASADANAIFVRDGNIYVGGYITPDIDSYSEQYATVWTNGTAQQLSDQQSKVTGIYVRAE